MEGKVIKKEWAGAVGNKKGEGVNYFSKVTECEQVREIHVIGGQLNIMIMCYLKRSVSVGKGFSPEQLLSMVAAVELGVSRLMVCLVRITHSLARGLRLENECMGVIIMIDLRI